MSCTRRSPRPTRASRKSKKSMEAFQGAAYPWFRVAELNYDSFMIRKLS